MIQKFYQQLTLWEPAAGRQGNAFSEWLHKLCLELPALDINSSQEMDGYSKQLQTMIESDLERSQKSSNAYSKPLTLVMHWKQSEKPSLHS